MDKKIKDSDIRIRINRQDKEELIKKAYGMDMSISGYIAKALDNYDKLQQIPDAVLVWQSYNEILRTIKQSNNEPLLQTVEEIICRYSPKIDN